jgi:hypothetical protein
MHALSDVPEHRPFEPHKTAIQTYQDEDYQPIYFVSESFEDMKEKLRLVRSPLCITPRFFHKSRGFQIQSNTAAASISEFPRNIFKMTQYAHVICHFEGFHSNITWTAENITKNKEKRKSAVPLNFLPQLNSWSVGSRSPQTARFWMISTYFCLKCKQNWGSFSQNLRHFSETAMLYIVRRHWF